MEFRAGAFNVFNHPEFDGPRHQFRRGSFGLITNLTTNARVTVGPKILFLDRSRTAIRITRVCTRKFDLVKAPLHGVARRRNIGPSESEPVHLLPVPQVP